MSIWRIPRWWTGVIANLWPFRRPLSLEISSLFARFSDLTHIANAQWRLLGKTKAPLSVRLQGRVHVSGRGQLVLGEGVSFAGTVVPVELATYDHGRIEIGEHTFINYGSSIAARTSVKIGSRCLLGHYTFIMDSDQHGIIKRDELGLENPVIIEDNVWIGAKAVILSGVRIGARAVIGAGSIVTNDIPPFCVAAGNPARVLRFLTELEEVETGSNAG